MTEIGARENPPGLLQPQHMFRMSLDQALVHEAGDMSAPGTHVILIGIGYYEHLKGGNGTEFTSAIRQLVSPPESVRVLADWFLQKYENPRFPLSSLSIVVSTKAAFAYTNPVTGIQSTSPLGTGADIGAAIKQWSERSRSHADNLAIFYFCGHGVDAGQTAFLLARDFGGDPAAHDDGFINQNAIITAMGLIGPAEQLFLIDSCRAEDPTLVEGGSFGRRPISGRPRGPGQPLPRQASIYATIRNAHAYGRLGSTSIFAENLIVGLETAASPDKHGEWWVGTHFLSKQIAARTAGNQRGKVDGEDIDICRLPDAPAIPVRITCDPAEAIHISRFSCHPPVGAAHCISTTTASFAGDAWETRLKPGHYTFQAEAIRSSDYQPVRVLRFVSPPHFQVLLETRFKVPGV